MQPKVMVLFHETTFTKDVFVHSSAVKDAGLNGLAEGEAITFEVEEGTKGPSAVNLQKG